MSEPATSPDLPDYLERDMAMLDGVLVELCHSHLDGHPLPDEAVTLLCERFISYSKAIVEAARGTAGNPGKNTGRVVSALVGLGWKPGAAIAAVSELTGQDPETVDKNRDRWKKRSRKGKNDE
jgi:hypothetical protein